MIEAEPPTRLVITFDDAPDAEAPREPSVEDMMDTTPLRNAFRALLDAAATVAESGDPSPAPPAGEWNADQILALLTGAA